MDRKQLPEMAWKEFTDTGRVGAYLLYRAVRRAEGRADRT